MKRHEFLIGVTIKEPKDSIVPGFYSAQVLHAEYPPCPMDVPQKPYYARSAAMAAAFALEGLASALKKEAVPQYG